MKLISSMQSFFFYPDKNEVVTSNDVPEDLSKLWMDTSVYPPLLKYHNGSEWIVINKTELDAIKERVTSAETTLNSLDATITSKCEETINTKVEDRLVGVETKTSNIVQNPESWTASFKYNEEDDSGNVIEKSNSIRLSMDGVDVGDSDSYSRMSKDRFAITLEGHEVASIDKTKVESDEVYARKRIRLGNVLKIATDVGFEIRWVGD